MSTLCSRLQAWKGWRKHTVRILAYEDLKRDSDGLQSVGPTYEVRLMQGSYVVCSSMCSLPSSQVAELMRSKISSSSMSCVMKSALPSTRLAGLESSDMPLETACSLQSLGSIIGRSLIESWYQYLVHWPSRGCLTVRILLTTSTTTETAFSLSMITPPFFHQD